MVLKRVVKTCARQYTFEYTLINNYYRWVFNMRLVLTLDGVQEGNLKAILAKSGGKVES